MRRNVLNIVIVSTALTLPLSASASTLQANGSLESSHYLDGVNLNDYEPAVSLAVDYTLDNGGFAGSNCYTSSANNDQGLKYGCSFYAGYFKPLSGNNAVSLQLTRHQYARGFDGEWSFNDIAANWHINKKTTLSTVYSKNWLNRMFDSLAIKGNTQIPVADRINFNFSASVLSFDSSAAVNNLISAKTTVSYSKQRWTAEAGLVISDSDQRRIIPFNVNQPGVFLTLTYRLY